MIPRDDPPLVRPEPRAAHLPFSRPRFPPDGRRRQSGGKPAHLTTRVLGRESGERDRLGRTRRRPADGTQSRYCSPFGDSLPHHTKVWVSHDVGGWGGLGLPLSIAQVCAHLSFWRGRADDYGGTGDASVRCARRFPSTIEIRLLADSSIGLAA